MTRSQGIMGRIVELSVVGLICIKPSRIVVCYTAVFSVVEQRSPPLRAVRVSSFAKCYLKEALNRLFFPSSCLVSILADLEQETNLELLNLHCWLKANKLSLNVAKTEFMVIGSRQKLLAESHNEINIKLEDQVISNVDHAKSLGLVIDNRLSWSNHVNELCKKVTPAIGALRRIRPLISQCTAVLVYNSLIQPHFDYCSLVCDQLSDKLQKLQNRAARVTLKASYGTSSSLLLDKL